MTRYRFNWAYHSSLHTALEGDEAEFEDDVAEAINRDSPGVLTRADAEPVADETRAVETPPADRMQRRTKVRNDRGGGETINRENFKAVKP